MQKAIGGRASMFSDNQGLDEDGNPLTIEAA
jgi:hypothetical protein